MKLGQNATTMTRLIKRATCVLLFASLSFSARPTAAGPIDFLKRVGNSIAHPHNAQPVRRTTRKNSGKRESANDSGRTPAQPIVSPSTTPTPTSTPVAEASPNPTPSPTPPTVRAASGVPATNFSRTDLPYGVPVPNKPGFVTSPYSPGGGFVDVRGYPSGIEVKDPYTGKIFRTP